MVNVFIAHLSVATACSKEEHINKHRKLKIIDCLSANYCYRLYMYVCGK